MVLTCKQWVPEHAVGKLLCPAELTSKGISPSVAAVATDAVTTSYHAVVQRGKLQPHETVVVFGLGGLGFNGLEVVRHVGARVLVTDVKQDRLDAAMLLGVPPEDVIPVGTPVQEFIKQRGLLGKVDVTLDFVGKHQTFQDAQQIGTSHFRNPDTPS